ncbi:MAG: prolipoprotein diacylglyceryl transferase [Acidobacteriota bacterium]
MISIDWNPMPYLGPIPINWYGITFAIAALTARWLALRSASHGFSSTSVDRLVLWILIGVVVGARLYYVLQNDFGFYVTHPWRVLAVWEGGLAFFGGLGGGIASGYVYCRRYSLDFLEVADIFAPTIPVAAAIGRISCGLDGMDYGTPTSLPWGIVYLNPNSYAPVDRVPRHPDQYYELAGDLVIAALLVRLRGRLPRGGLLLVYLVSFSILRFFIFFVRGNVPVIALGLKNAQWTSLLILLASLAVMLRKRVSAYARESAPRKR